MKTTPSTINPARRFVVARQRDGRYLVQRQDGTHMIFGAFTHRADADHRAAAENRYDEQDAPPTKRVERRRLTECPNCGHDLSQYAEG